MLFADCRLHAALFSSSYMLSSESIMLASWLELVLSPCCTPLATLLLASSNANLLSLSTNLMRAIVFRICRGILSGWDHRDKLIPSNLPFDLSWTHCSHWRTTTSMLRLFWLQLASSVSCYAPADICTKVDVGLNYFSFLIQVQAILDYLSLLEDPKPLETLVYLLPQMLSSQQSPSSSSYRCWKRPKEDVEDKL